MLIYNVSSIVCLHASDVRLTLGDSNARVGSGEKDDVWNGVHGKHGVGRMNASGEALLSWCALNGLVILNTSCFFEKKCIHKYTWQHPGSKQGYCEDYVLMRQGHRSLCYDASVLRSADYWTDHKLVHARLCCIPDVKKSRELLGRFALSHLKDSKVCDCFQLKVAWCLQQEAFLVLRAGSSHTGSRLVVLSYQSCLRSIMHCLLNG